MFIFCVPQNNRPGPAGTKGAKGHRGPEGSAVSAPLRVFSMCFPYWSMIKVDILYYDSCSQMKVHMSTIFCTNFGAYISILAYCNHCICILDQRDKHTDLLYDLSLETFEI